MKKNISTFYTITTAYAFDYVLYNLKDVTCRYNPNGITFTWDYAEALSSYSAAAATGQMKINSL